MCVVNHMDSLRGAIDEAMQIDPDAFDSLHHADDGEWWNESEDV